MGLDFIQSRAEKHAANGGKLPGKRPSFGYRKALKAENDELRRAMVQHSATLEEWEALLPQDMRDALAARALIASEGDAFRAAVRLGLGRQHRPEAAEVLPRIFGTPGVREILARDLREPEQNKQDLIARQVKIALYGEDTVSVRAYQMLAKTCGWVTTPDVLVQHNRQTILALVTQKNNRGENPIEALEEALPSFLEHEPGAAVRIDSGDETVASIVGGTE